MLLAFNGSGEIQLDTAAVYRIDRIGRVTKNGVVYNIYVDSNGYRWSERVDSPGGQLTAPLKPAQSTPAWLEEFAGPFPLGFSASPTSSPTSHPPSPTAHLTDAFFGVTFARNSDTPAATPLIGSPIREGASPRHSTPSPVSDYGRKGGYSIEPPPPIRGGTSDALYFNPGWWQVYQNRRQAEQKAGQDLDKVNSSLIVAPLAYLEEYLVRPVLNVPHSALNKVITAGQHLDRGSLWLQQDEWAEAGAEGLEAVADLALAFLEVGGLLESLGFKDAPARGRQLAPRASLAGETPASVPHEYPRAALAEEIPASVPHEYPRAALAEEIPAATKEPVNIVLGVAEDHLRGLAMPLQDFATQRGGLMFSEWGKAGLTDLPVPALREAFREYFKDALRDPSKISRIDFNLQAVATLEDVLTVLKRVNEKKAWWTQHNVTKSELLEVLINSELFPKTVFWRGGQRVFPVRRR
jgi:hypothetical protein